MRTPFHIRATMGQTAKVDVEEAVNLYYGRIYHFCLHLTRNPEDAADLTQYGYEMLARNASKITGPGKVKSWLHSTVYRRFIDQRRRATRFPSVELDESHLGQDEHMQDKDNRIDAKTALDAMHELDDDLRAPLSLFYLEDYSYKEIAESLDLPIGTVMSRLYRGKKQLYSWLTEKV